MPVKTFLAGGGDAGALIRIFDWPVTPLGPPEQWPDSLRTALSVCLNSTIASAVYWGPDFITLYNDAWAQQQAGRHPWSMGRPARESRADIWATIGPQFAEVRATGRGVSVTDQRLAIHREGDRESWWSYSVIPLFEHDGKVGGLLTQGFETTAQIRARQMLDQQTARLREMFHQAPGAVAILHGPDHIYELANEAYYELVGQRRDILGKSLAEALPEIAEQGFVDLMHTAYRTGEPFVGRSVPVSINRGDTGKPETRMVDFVYQPIRNADGEVADIFVEATDVTERVMAAAALARSRDELEAAVKERTDKLMHAEGLLRQAQKMEAIGQLTGGIAHDFNNMLAVVMSGLNLLQRKLKRGETDVDRFIEGAMEGAQRAAALTSRLLAFSRQQQLAPVSLDANALVEGMTDLLSRTLGQAIRVDTNLSPGLWPTLVDANQLESAILNLAVNARDAMEQGGTLTIETSNVSLDAAYATEYAIAPGDYVSIAVTDTGTGMTPDIIAKAFDPFFTTKDVGKGTGLGLSQVFGFIRQSGGHVKIHSEPKLGATVKIYLPRGNADGVTDDRKTTAGEGANGASSGAGEVVMVVEDEERVRANSVETLRELGYSVVEARSPADALRLIEAGMSPALLFTDVMMPEMNGRQLAERAVAIQPGLKVLYTTGYTGNTALSNGLLDPGMTFVSKPFTIDQLALKVRQTLDS